MIISYVCMPAARCARAQLAAPAASYLPDWFSSQPAVRCSQSLEFNSNGFMPGLNGAKQAFRARCVPASLAYSSTSVQRTMWAAAGTVQKRETLTAIS